MMMTAEQREAVSVMADLNTEIICPGCGAWIGFDDIKPHMQVLRSLLSGEPAWEATRDRKLGLQYAIELMEQPGGNDRKKEGYRGVLRAMLEEAGQK